MKYCNGCSCHLNLDEFGHNKRRRDGHQDWCKKCCKRLRDRPAAKIRQSVCVKQWKLNNTERVLASENRHKITRWKWRHSDRGRFIRSEIQRVRYHKTRGDGTLTTSEWREILVMYDGRCAYCYQPSEKLQLEHIHPLSKGGTHTADNVVPACPSCNYSKGSKSLLRWMYDSL